MDMNLSRLQEILEDRGAWPAAIHGIAKNQTQLSNWTIPKEFSFMYIAFNIHL